MSQHTSAFDRALDFAFGRIAAMDDCGYFFPTLDWPNVQRDYLVKMHLKQMERLNFMAFLIGNGMDPDTAALWVLYPGNRYDREAHLQVKTLASAIPARGINTSYWDIQLGTYVNIKTGAVQTGSTGKRRYHYEESY